MSQVPVQVSPFSPVTAYDAPGTVFSMLLDGEMTPRGGMEAFFDSSRLSPAERNTIAERLKKAAGDASVTNALTDIALNPWVWMFALTSPVGVSALRKGAGMVFRSAPEYASWNRESSTILQQIGASPALATLRNSPMLPAAAQANAAYTRFINATVDRYRPELEALLEKHGLSTLDASRIADPQKAAVAEEINKTLAASLSGLDRVRPTTQTTLTSKFYKIEDGVKKEVTFDDWRELAPSDRDHDISLSMMQKNSLPLVRGLEQRLGELGAVPLRDKIRDALNAELKTLYLNDAGDIDERKLVQQWRAIRNPIMNGSVRGDTTSDGADLIGKLLGPEFRGLIETGSLKQEDYVNYIRSTFRSGLNADTYFPRNATTTILADGRTATDDDLRAMWKARAFRVPGQAINRTSSSEDYAVEELQWLKNNLDGTPELDRAISNAQGRLQDNADRGRASTFHLLDASESLSKHFRVSGESYAWHLQEPNDETLAVLRRALQDRDTVGSGFTVPGHDSFQPNAFAGGSGAPLGSHPGDIPAEQQPGGGFNLADIAYQSWALDQNPYARDTIAHIVIPGATGRLGVTHAATMQAAITARMWAGQFAESRLGQLIGRTGKVGANLIDDLSNWSKLNTTPSDAGSLSRYISHVLYASSLGLNMSAVITNASQPWLWGAAFLGAGNVAKGYGRALQEMSDYFQDRVKLGLGEINDAARNDLIRKNFRWANFDGEDYIGISHSIEEALDPLTFKNSDSGMKARSEKLFHFLLKPFEKVEWLNRSVMAHATEAAHEAAGPVDLGLLKADVRHAVSETQFGSNFLNTPAAFATADPRLTPFGRIGNNPLARQFLSFPIRSLTTLIDVAPRIGQGERTLGLTGITVNNPLLVAGHDVLRGMAISAVGYELGKNLLGADLSHGLFAESLGQLPMQFVSDKNGAVLPAPPVLDIAAGFGQFLTSGDTEFLRKTMPRVIPGGVALSKAAGLLPGLPSWASTLTGQKTYAGWGQMTADGRVPVFDNRGNMIELETPATLIFRGLGADLGRFQQTGSLEKFLLNNREEILQYRQQYIAHTLNGNQAAADGVAGEFQKRFKLPLTVTKAQLTAAMRLRQTPRTERILDRLPQEARQPYQQIVAQQPGRFNVPQQVLLQQATAKGRDPWRGVPAARVTPAQLPALQQQYQQQDAQQRSSPSAATWGLADDVLLPAFRAFEAF